MRRQVIPKLSAIHAPHEPGLKRVESLRAGDRNLTQVRPTPLRAEEVRSLFLQRAKEVGPIAHQHSTRGQRHEHHFVRVEDK